MRIVTIILLILWQVGCGKKSNKKDTMEKIVPQKKKKKIEKLTEEEKVRKGKKVFQKNCLSCHFVLKGKKTKPYPSLEDLSEKPFDEFERIVKQGIPNTAMIPRRLTPDEIRQVHLWLQFLKRSKAFK